MDGGYTQNSYPCQVKLHLELLLGAKLLVDPAGKLSNQTEAEKTNHRCNKCVLVLFVLFYFEFSAGNAGPYD